eukprot:CAMPEP_0119182516 /NCGR_PEP_ID=MMETSP1315-20130426/62101_1 /TAXON_ID=676789 /ORGANISM="Prasinoderma singularis, Strain RCC927" /LENGTH=110 /DNA_ID=CAMNT_0007176865 /DNA_START=42 /DNA_END=372 /DNA_ORIENTATION=-
MRVRHRIQPKGRHQIIERLILCVESSQHTKVEVRVVAIARAPRATQMHAQRTSASLRMPFTLNPKPGARPSGIDIAAAASDDELKPYMPQCVLCLLQDARWHSREQYRCV